MKYLLLNSAMMPDAGKYHMLKISKTAFFLAISAVPSEIHSFIGYPQNVEFIRKNTGLTFPVTREKCTMEKGDVAFVMRIKYRVEGVKGAPVNEDDFEFFRIEKMEDI